MSKNSATAQPYAELKIRGEKYKLCFTFGAIEDARARLRAIGVRTNLMVSVGDIDFDNVVPLLAAALYAYHRDLSFDQVRALVDLDTMGAVTQAIQAAWVEAFPKVDPPAAAPAAAE